MVFTILETATQRKFTYIITIIATRPYLFKVNIGRAMYQSVQS